jgi:4-amino-4-deoxy-L-arabinose transferase
MILSYFSETHIVLLVISSLALIASVLLFHTGRSRGALLLLFLASLGLGFFVGGLDDFLVLWDEQYHALVAKNMMSHPFKPSLYSDPILDYDYRTWTANHIWLHKQPLFLWQIALSLKIFGVNELAVRIPSIVMHAAAVVMVYRIGKISVSSATGFYGALFFAVSYYILELAAGKFATDHNDIAFLFYVTAAFWAWFEYQRSQNKYWLIAIGIFSGFAVLVKWLTGMLIYAVWLIVTASSNSANFFRMKTLRPMLISFFISLAVFIPWQLYVLHAFPDEARYEFHLNTAHFFSVIENHGGNYLFHFNAIKNIYGSGFLVPFLLLGGLIVYCKKSPEKKYCIASVSAIIITYTFYTIAATKMTSFCIIVSPFVFLGMGALTDSAMTILTRKIKWRNAVITLKLIAVLLICFFIFDLNRIANYHTSMKPHDNCNRDADTKQMKMINQISRHMAGNGYAVFNCDLRVNGHIAVMFYTGCVAYGFIPDQKQISKIKASRYKMIIVDNGILPDYIINDEEILKLKMNSERL